MMSQFRRRAFRLSSDDLQRLTERLRSHVDVLAGLIGPRHLGKPEALEAAAGYIERQFAEIGDAVVRQPYPVGNQTAANLVVERLGTHRPAEIVVVGAHYDTIPITPGADDNASAVAMLIEVARMLLGRRARRTLRFVSFPCEEMPHFHSETMGSQQYARRCRANHERIVGMICLEMVGYYSAEAGSQEIPPSIPRRLRWIFPSRGDFLAAVANPRSLALLWKFRWGYRRSSSDLRLFAIALPERIHEIRRSDNSSFWDQGYSALMITDTSFLRNANYHQSTDIPNTLDYPRLAQATIGVAGAAACVAKTAS
jgi:Zn-dependent M28 family amino/carboxypeptidase